jgi:hypothetical protein
VLDLRAVYSYIPNLMGIVATNSSNLGKADKISPPSKFIALIEYDPKSSSMEITFKSGTKYRYNDVSPLTYLSFKQSPTIDAYYARAIKGNLSSVKLVDQGTGRQKSAPLDQVKERKTLNAGLKKQQSANEREYGTVDRAFAAIT